MKSTDATSIFFLSSSGHCTLDCSYCIIQPIAKHQPSLTITDLEYLLDTVGDKSALLFSGKGDFFAGYKKGEQLLSRLLERDVDIALDINGVLIQEFETLPDAKVQKIKHINLTMHYAQLLKKNALSLWERNAKLLMQRQPWESFLINTVLSPHDVKLWKEALSFYEGHVFKKTQMPLVLIKDAVHWDDAFQDQLETLHQQFAHIITETRAVDFTHTMGPETLPVLCPAGQSYFRVWHDGRIEGCPYIPALSNCGNAKLRTFTPRPTAFICDQPNYCDCHHIKRLGKMRAACVSSTPSC